MDDLLYRVVRNRSQCHKFEDIIESTNRHDFVSCKCGAIFTDGGTAYIRRGAKDLGDIIDLSEYELKELNHGI